MIESIDISSSTAQVLSSTTVDEQLLRKAIDTSSCAITLADASKPDLPLIYVNRTFETMTGYNRGQVLGKNCRFLQGQSSQQSEAGKIKQQLTDHTDCTVTLLNYKSTGEPFYNELHIAPLKNHSGNVSHFVGIQTDVTDKVLLQRAVLQQKEQLEEAVKDRTRELHVKNQTLQEVLSHLEREKNKTKEVMDANIEAVIIPLLNDLRSKVASKDKYIVEMIEQQLSDLLSPLGHKLSNQQYRLTRKEMQVCTLITQGLSSKGIARHFGISPSTVENQRNTIRKKLGIAGKAINLEQYLLSFPEFSIR